MRIPGPLGLKATAIAVVIGLLNLVGMVPAFPDVPAAVVAVVTFAAAYAWVFVLQKAVRVLLGGGLRGAAS